MTTDFTEYTDGDRALVRIRGIRAIRGEWRHRFLLASALPRQEVCVIRGEWSGTSFIARNTATKQSTGRFALCFGVTGVPGVSHPRSDLPASREARQAREEAPGLWHHNSREAIEALINR